MFNKENKSLKLSKYNCFSEASKEKIVNDIANNLSLYNGFWENGSIPLKSFNPITNTVYKGMNNLLTSYKAVISNDNRFTTFSEIRKNGWTLNKGSKSVTVFFKNFTEKEITEDEFLDEINKGNGDWVKQVDDKFFKINKMKIKYDVFNFSEIDGAPKIENISQIKPTNEEIEKLITLIIKHSFCKINYSPFATSEHYNLASDEICVCSNAISSESKLNTLIHELIHATNHETRLNRWKNLKFKHHNEKEKYAFEELIAGLGQIFAITEMQIPYDNKNNVLYIKSWLKALKNNKDYLFDAAEFASKAFNYIFENVLQKAIIDWQEWKSTKLDNDLN